MLHVGKKELLITQLGQNIFYSNFCINTKFHNMTDKSECHMDGHIYGLRHQTFDIIEALYIWMDTLHPINVQRDDFCFVSVAITTFIKCMQILSNIRYKKLRI